MLNITNFDKYIGGVPFIAIMTGISSDPNPPKAWVKLINNLFVRFLFIYILIYETTKDMNLSLNVSVGVMLFFYIIANEEEKKKYIDSANFNFEDLNIFKNILY